MSVLSIDPSAWVPAAVVLASLSGSAHCAAMCGGLVTSSARNRTAWVAYQWGRLLGYLALGAVGGFLGEHVLGAPLISEWLSLGTAVILGIGFIFAAARVWNGKIPHLNVIPRGSLMWLYQRTEGSAWATGLLSSLLPCGWLHTFVLGSIATKSSLHGALFLFAFWIGTLPALATTPWLVRNAFRPLFRRAPRVAASFLLFAGLYSIGYKLVPFVLDGSHEHHSCHSMEE